MPLPSPWIMGVLAIGAGVLSWWLEPGSDRREAESSRSASGRQSPFQTWRRLRSDFPLDAVLCIGLGVLILLVAAGGTS